MAYTFIEGTQLIMTKVVNKEEIEKLEFSEFNELRTKELKFLTALTFLNSVYRLTLKPLKMLAFSMIHGIINARVFSN